MPTFAPDTAVGTLAPGFPPEFATLPTGATTVASAATPGPTTTRISLTLRSPQSVAELAAFYAELLAQHGFTAVPTPTPEGLAAISGYTRTSADAATTETLTVAILDAGPSRSLSVSGDVLPTAP